MIDGATAAELGIVQWAFDSGELSEKVNAIAEHIASQPREAVMRAKACIAAALDPARDGFAEEIEATRFLGSHAEARTRIAAFLARSK
ncbi:MAG: hypothetical protein HY525_00735 [Betaproteobacteria bacterium]|nr:hypothetical protein [Betaproteobacteria bacterium]